MMETGSVHLQGYCWRGRPCGQ